MPGQPKWSFAATARFMARADVFSFALLWLMALLVLGTLTEKSDGLYAAQQAYFSSWIFWAFGALPLPGLRLTASFIFAGLLAKLGRDEWRWRRLGTIVVHLGVLLLLFGGFVTGYFSSGGSMVIPQGQSRNYIEDDDRIELAVSDADRPGQAGESVFSAGRLTPGAVLSDARLPFRIGVLSYCRNCGLLRLPAARTEGRPHGVAINFDLRPLPRAHMDEDNKAGLTFTLSGTDDHDGLYAVFEGMPIPEIIATGGHRYLIAVRHARIYLPFSVRLLRFERKFYPGTDKPRSYQSEVVLTDGGVAWHSLIEMNAPLRYKGYTFYQASFIEGGPEATTVLAVVKNAGRLFPYLASVIIALGLLIHLAQRLPRLLPAGRR